MFLTCFNVNAETPRKTVIEERDGGIHISNISTKELEIFFESIGYTEYLRVKDLLYPPVFLNEMPYDFAEITDSNQRNDLFMRIIIPLALKINEEILFERGELLEIHEYFRDNKDLTKEQRARLDSLAEKYNEFTRLQGLRRYTLLIDRLEKKIDVVPPSFIVAISAIETNWGTAKHLKKANSLFKEYIWYSDEGLEVEDDKEDRSYRIRIFPSLYAAIQSFTLDINSNINFELFRHSRANIINRGKYLNGRDMAHDMIWNSSLENFVGLLNYTITFYELQIVDKSSLGFPE